MKCVESRLCCHSSVGRSHLGGNGGGGLGRSRPGRGRTAAGSRSAGNKGVYFPGYSYGVKQFYPPGSRPGWFGDYNKKGRGQEVSCTFIYHII